LTGVHNQDQQGEAVRQVFEIPRAEEEEDHAAEVVKNSAAKIPAARKLHEVAPQQTSASAFPLWEA